MQQLSHALSAKFTEDKLQQYIGFTVGANQYIIPILKVREIIRMPRITTLPSLPDYVSGVTDLRGSVIPVLSLALLLHSAEESSSGNMVIVLTSGHITFGIVVNDIMGVMTVDDAQIEPSERFFNTRADKVEGVAKLDGQLLVVLDVKKLLPVDDISLLEDSILNVREVAGNDTVEVVREMQTSGGTVTVKELRAAREFFGSRLDSSTPHQKILEHMMHFIDALAVRDYQEIKTITDQLMKDSHSELFNEVSMITRRLYTSFDEFKKSVDAGLERLSRSEMPGAIEKLNYVIAKSEDAANRTMGIVEQYFEEAPEYLKHLDSIKIAGIQDLPYFQMFKESLDSNMTEILTAQQYQDLTGQIIRKVIELIHGTESELSYLMGFFATPTLSENDRGNTSPDELPGQIPSSGRITQSDVEALLRNYGL